MKKLQIIFISSLIIEVLNIIERIYFRSVGLSKSFTRIEWIIFLLISLIIFYSLKIIYQKYNFKMTFWKLFLFGIGIITLEYCFDFIMQNIDFYILKNEITNEDLTNVPDYMREFARSPHFSPITDLVFGPIQILVYRIMENKDFWGFIRWTLANRFSLTLILTFITFKIYRKNSR